MLSVEMTDIETTSEDGEALLIEGGWTLQVVEIGAERSDRALLVRRYQRQGWRPWKAKELADEALQEVYTAGYVRRIRAFLRRLAKEYASRYGDLRGFEPERLQDLFLPAENYGRRGNPEATERMVKMRAAIQEEAA